MSAPILPAPRISTRCIKSPFQTRSSPACWTIVQFQVALKRRAFCSRRPPGASGLKGGPGAGFQRSHDRSRHHAHPPTITSWHSATWQSKVAQQQPTYADPKALESAVAHLSRLPPIVVSWEIDALRERLAAAQRGQAFLLQGGDCAETFADCESDTIAKKLKILLQMSLVLLHGLKSRSSASDAWPVSTPSLAPWTPRLATA